MLCVVWKHLPPNAIRCASMPNESWNFRPNIGKTPQAPIHQHRCATLFPRVQRGFGNVDGPSLRTQWAGRHLQECESFPAAHLQVKWAILQRSRGPSRLRNAARPRFVPPKLEKLKSVWMRRDSVRSKLPVTTIAFTLFFIISLDGNVKDGIFIKMTQIDTYIYIYIYLRMSDNLG